MPTPFFLLGTALVALPWLSLLYGASWLVWLVRLGGVYAR